LKYEQENKIRFSD